MSHRRTDGQTASRPSAVPVVTCAPKARLGPGQGVPCVGTLYSRAAERQDLVRYARQRLARQLGQRGAALETVAEASHGLDPNALTLGFARRFAAYKRPTILLHDPERLTRLLTHTT